VHHPQFGRDDLNVEVEHFGEGGPLFGGERDFGGANWSTDHGASFVVWEECTGVHPFVNVWMDPNQIRDTFDEAAANAR
jgi:hypothetical protein